MTDPTTPIPRRRHDDHHRRPEVHLPRSLVVSFVVSVVVLVIVGLFGIVVTNQRAADSAKDTQTYARCLMLQLLEQRAYGYAYQQAAAARTPELQQYDDKLPSETRPPDIAAVLELLRHACDDLVPSELLTPPSIVTTTTTTVRPAAGATGPAGAAGRAGRDAPTTTAPRSTPVGPRATTTTAPSVLRILPTIPAPRRSSRASTTTTTAAAPSLPPVTVPPALRTLPTLPIGYTTPDPYAASMISVLAPFAGAVLVLLVWAAGHRRARRLEGSLARHQGGHTLR